jgi:hypothetical protein
MSWPVAAIALLAVALAAPLSGCLSCVPHLDVRNCAPDSELCRPGEGDRVLDWDPQVGTVFPDVAVLLASTELGRHGHADWTREQADAFWAFWDMPPTGVDRQVFFREGGELFRVRVLEC